VAAAPETYRNGRDALCVGGGDAGLKAGLIAYGEGNGNCSLSGPAVRNRDLLVITPQGDQHCRVEVRIDGQGAVVGPRIPACAYYCGPGADYAGRVLRRSASGGPVTDLAGDLLC